MGHRASYVLIEDGAITAYYSHWGAKVAPAVVLGGFAETCAYLRALAPADGLLDTVWAEGGILLDADTHTLRFWGGESLRDRPDLRRLFLPSVGRLWPGWAVAWATQGVVDFAEYPGVAQALGQDPASRLDDDPEKWVPYSEAELLTPREEPWLATVLTVRWDDGGVADYTFDHDPPGYLTYGPELLGILRGRPPDALPREDGDGQGNYPIGGAYADVPARTLWLWVANTRHPAYGERVRQAWPGWHVDEHVDSLAQQIRLSGRDPALVTTPRDRVIAELLDTVTNAMSWGEAFDPGAFVRQTMTPTEREAATFAQGFFRVDQPPTPATPAQGREVLLNLLQRVSDEQALEQAHGSSGQ